MGAGQLEPGGPGRRSDGPQTPSMCGGCDTQERGMWKQSCSCCGCMCPCGASGVRGPSRRAYQTLFLGVKDIWDSQGGVGGSLQGLLCPWSTFPSVPLFKASSPEWGGQMSQPSHTLRFPESEARPRASHETKQWFLWREDATLVALHTVCGGHLRAVSLGLSPSWVPLRPLHA